MDIQTKFSIGQFVFILAEEKVHEIEVESFDIYVRANSYIEEITIKYELKESPYRLGQRRFYENELFSTKEELLQSL